MNDPIVFDSREELGSFLCGVHKIKPKTLILEDVKWKHLVRSILRGKTTLITGPTRCGKTTAAREAAKALRRPFMVFNFGGTQDARATLIGNTTFKKDKGTVFNPSPFVTGIQTPHMVIVLDELTRGSYESWNIIMPTIDETQRCLRLDETSEGSVIDVKRGVSFIATANIGAEYTATRTLDLALSFRFSSTLEMERLKKANLLKLLRCKFPDATEEQLDMFQILAQISDDISENVQKEDAVITTEISNGKVVEMADLLMDGFTLKEVVEVSIYPLYSDDGGMASERVAIKQLVQKYVGPTSTSPINDPLRSEM